MPSAQRPLSPEQLNHFDTFGFLSLRQLLTAAEVATLRAEYEAELDHVYAHSPFDGTERHWTLMLSERTPLFASLLADERFCLVAEQLYGDDVVAIAADANRYVGHTRWHVDHDADPKKDCHGVKFAFYLDAVDGASGALRVIPGSHRQPYHQQVSEALEAMALPIDEVASHICASTPGDVVAFDMRCWHASWGGTTGRRMCTCIFYKNPVGEAEEALVRRRAEDLHNTHAQFGRAGAQVFPDHWLRNPGNSRRKAHWLRRLRELGYLEATSA